MEINGFKFLAHTSCLEDADLGGLPDKFVAQIKDELNNLDVEFGRARQPLSSDGGINVILHTREQLDDFGPRFNVSLERSPFETVTSCDGWWNCCCITNNEFSLGIYVSDSVLTDDERIRLSLVRDADVTGVDEGILPAAAAPADAEGSAPQTEQTEQTDKLLDLAECPLPFETLEVLGKSDLLARTGLPMIVPQCILDDLGRRVEDVRQSDGSVIPAYFLLTTAALDAMLGRLNMVIGGTGPYLVFRYEGAEGWTLVLSADPDMSGGSENPTVPVYAVFPDSAVAGLANGELIMNAIWTIGEMVASSEPEADVEEEWNDDDDDEEGEEFDPGEDYRGEGGAQEASRYDSPPNVPAFVTMADANEIARYADLPAHAKHKLQSILSAWDSLGGGGRRNWMEGDGAAFVVRDNAEVEELMDFARYYGAGMDSCVLIQNPFSENVGEQGDAPRWLCAKYTVQGYFAVFVLAPENAEVIGEALLETWKRYYT
jgi:hypothetical protein